MKYILLLTILLFIAFNGNTQSNYQTKKISSDIELIKLSENVYNHVSYTVLPNYGRVPANGLIFINGSDAFIVDSPWNDSLTAKLFSWITDSMHLHIAGFIPTHFHDDCMGGLSYIRQQGIPGYANHKTIDIARSKNLPVPDYGFSDSLILHFGDKTIECYYPGAAHTKDNIAIWIPSENILFAGCMVKSISSKNLGNTTDGDLEEYPKTIDKLLDKFPDVKIVIPGHGPAGGMELIRHTKELATE